MTLSTANRGSQHTELFVQHFPGSASRSYRSSENIFRDHYGTYVNSLKKVRVPSAARKG